MSEGVKQTALYDAVIKKYGAKHQVSVAIGELGELINELSKEIRGVPNIMHIYEEMADVEICLGQLKKIYDPSDKKIKLFKQFKLNRLKTFYIEGEAK
jgi:hypothetical protein